MKKYLKNTILLFGLIIFILAGCSDDPDEKSSNYPSLSILYTENSDAVVRAISKMIVQEDMEIKDEVISLSTYEDQRKKIMTRIMSGDGPEITVTPPSFFDSISKAGDSGYFLDLHDFMKNSKYLNEEEYFMNLMDLSDSNKKQFFMPATFSFNAFITTEGNKNKYFKGLNINTYTWDDLFSITQEVMKDPELKYFFNYPFTNYSIIDTASQLIDFKNKKANINSPEFIKALQDYKKIYGTICTYEESKKSSHCQISQLKDKEAALFLMSFDSIKTLDIYYSMFINELNEKMAIVPLPKTNIGSKDTSVNIHNVCAINAKCKNKELAYKFLKLMLSEEIQTCSSDYYQNKNALFLPVNKKSFLEDIRFYSDKSIEKQNYSMGYSEGINYSGKFVKMPDIFSNQFLSICESAGTPVLLDSQIISILYGEVDKYINNKRSVEETAKIINEKVTLLLNE